MSPLSLFRGDVSCTEAERMIMDFIVACPAEKIRRLDDLRALKRRNEMRLPR